MRCKGRSDEPPRSLAFAAPRGGARAPWGGPAEVGVSVVAIGAYNFPAADAAANFPAPLLYVGWDDHLLFCAPVCLPLPPSMPFGALASSVLPGVYGEHPDFARIDWGRVQWLKSGRPWLPDYTKTLADNGLKHKDVIRFCTPGLSGIGGSHS